jgi:asparagine synthase (glutamine-hydrolysing)
VSLRNLEDRHIRAYWSAPEVARTAVATGFSGEEQEAIEMLDGILTDAVQSRMLADVPLGALLSGGIDSSMIVSLMQKSAGGPIKTFSIGTEGSAYDEAIDARRVAEHLGSDHTDLYVSRNDVLEVVSVLADVYSEPFGDSSQIPTWLVSRLARQKVKVALSGDGGDELFAGYNRYSWGNRIWNRMVPIPRAIRRPVSHVLEALTPPLVDFLLSTGSLAIPRSKRIRLPGQKLRKLAGMMRVEDYRDLHRELLSHWKDPATAVIDGLEPPPGQEESFDGLVEQMMLNDLVGYLPDDILTKVDRASMFFGLEVRVPLLDHRVVEFVWRLPLHLKLRGSETKWILRRVLDRYVPPQLVDRQKAGFSVPVAEWLRGPLRDWGDSLLSRERLGRDGIFNVGVVSQRWSEHRSGRRDWHESLWDVLMFQAWLDRWGSKGVHVGENHNLSRDSVATGRG